jgi:poly-gamma-glutamate synthesis protein (capsule biosynthesis protein)
MGIFGILALSLRGEAKPTQTLEMTFVGDIMFGRYRDAGFDPIPPVGSRPFAEIKTLLHSDLAVGNLETPVVPKLPESNEITSPFRFGASVDLAKHLTDAGLHAVSLANNHAYDLEDEGLVQTPRILKKLGLIPLGVGAPKGAKIKVDTVTRKGWRVAFIALTAQPVCCHRNKRKVTPFAAIWDISMALKPLITTARASHEIVVVLIHWGDEWAQRPTESQQSVAHLLIEHGAHLVIGHHPHVLQGIEYYRGGVIAYSLGNFLFENIREIPRQTGILRVRFSRGIGMEKVTFHPTYIRGWPYRHPRPAPRGLANTIAQRMTDLSTELNTQWQREGKDLVLVLESITKGDAVRNSTARSKPSGPKIPSAIK